MKRLLKNLKSIFLHITIILVVFLMGYTLNSYLTFDPSQIKFHTTSTKVYDREGDLLYEISADNAVRNQPIKISEIPDDCKDAVISIEDKTFRTNIGVDRNGILRLGLTFATFGKYRAGGSSITQQVIKTADNNIYGRNPLDKIKESMRAIKLTQYYSKDEILSMYLNNVYFGNLNYGIQSASLDYFGKEVRDLSLPECAYLVGLPQSPSIYNPYANLDLGLIRKNQVLTAMFENGYLDLEQLEDTKSQSLNFTENDFEIRAPHFVQFLQDNLSIKKDSQSKVVMFDDKLENLNWKESYDLYTYYDYDLHQELLNLIRSKVSEENERGWVLSNAAAVVIDAQGNLIVMIGSLNFFDDEINGKFNSALGYRQPGELYVPLVYDFLLKNYDVENTNALRNVFQAKDVLRIKKEGEVVEDFLFVNSNYRSMPDEQVNILDSSSAYEVIPALNFSQSLNLETTEFQNGVTLGNGFDCNQIFLLEGCESTLLDLVWNYHVIRNGETSFNVIESVSVDDEVLYKSTLSPDIDVNLNGNVSDNQASSLYIEATNLAEKDLWQITSNDSHTLGIWYEIVRKN